MKAYLLVHCWDDFHRRLPSRSLLVSDGETTELYYLCIVADRQVILAFQYFPISILHTSLINRAVVTMKMEWTFHGLVYGWLVLLVLKLCYKELVCIADTHQAAYDIISRVLRNLCRLRTGIRALVDGVLEVERATASITAATSSSESTGGAPSSRSPVPWSAAASISC